MYLTQRPNDVIALDADDRTRLLDLSPQQRRTSIVCCGSNNRGVAILGEPLFMGTLDGHLVAIDARSGRAVWKTQVADSKPGYSITVAPLALKDRVDRRRRRRRIRHSRLHRRVRRADRQGDVALLHDSRARASRVTKRGKRARPIAKTYCDPEAWKHGGGSVWVTGSYDPDLNLTYWGTGNAGPDYNARPAARRQPLHRRRSSRSMPTPAS